MVYCCRVTVKSKIGPHAAGLAELVSEGHVVHARRRLSIAQPDGGSSDDATQHRRATHPNHQRSPAASAEATKFRSRQQQQARYSIAIISARRSVLGLVFC